MKTCEICGCKFDNVDPKIKLCSPICTANQELLQQVERMILNTATTEDSRIFFFPLTFGELVDRYSVFSLRRCNTRSVRVQQELDYRLFKLRKSLETHVAQLFHNNGHRSKIRESLQNLHMTNATIWRLRDWAKDKRLPEEDRKNFLFQILDHQDTRDKLVQELDILVSRKSLHFKVYNYQDF